MWHPKKNNSSIHQKEALETLKFRGEKARKCSPRKKMNKNKRKPRRGIELGRLGCTWLYQLYQLYHCILILHHDTHCTPSHPTSSDVEISICTSWTCNNGSGHAVLVLIGNWCLEIIPHVRYICIMSVYINIYIYIMCTYIYMWSNLSQNKRHQPFWFGLKPLLGSEYTAGSLFQAGFTGAFKHGPCLSFVRFLGTKWRQKRKIPWELGMLHTKRGSNKFPQSKWFLYTIPKGSDPSTGNPTPKPFDGML